MRAKMAIGAALWLMLSSVYASGQWVGGFHRGGHTAGHSELYDGHKYNYARPAQDTLVTGRVSAEAVYMGMGDYRLDTDNDGIGDYYLDFGPWWYFPEGLSRPQNGDQCTIKGSLFQFSGDIDILVVQELNGMTWKSFGHGIGLAWSGAWLYPGSGGAQVVFNPVDSMSFVRFDGDFMGHMHGHMGGGMAVPDSFYCDFAEIPFELMPIHHGDSLLAGFHFDFLDDTFETMMGGEYSWGRGMMGFNRDIGFTIHYGRGWLDSLGINPHDLVVHRWSEPDSLWVALDAVHVDEHAGLLSFDVREAAAYYAVAYPSAVTSVEGPAGGSPGGYALFQNYPNPFNSSTIIRFQVPAHSRVVIGIYDIAGRLIRTAADGEYPAGIHTAVWDGLDADNMPVASGVYFYRIASGPFEKAGKLLYLK